MTKITCEKCNKKIRSEWVSIKLATKQLVYSCDCPTKNQPRQRIKHYREPVAFYKNSKGQEIAVDQKGREFDPTETRYDLHRDPHGWRAVGKKVRDTDKYGRPM